MTCTSCGKKAERLGRNAGLTNRHPCYDWCWECYRDKDWSN